MRARHLLLRLALVIALAAACVDGGAASNDAGVDAGTNACHPLLPEPSAPCLEGQCGNELGVGQSCTKGGNECGDLGLGNAILCTADFSDTELWFCTKGCDVDDDCGSDAVCTGDPDDPFSSKGCTPARCVE